MFMRTRINLRLMSFFFQEAKLNENSLPFLVGWLGTQLGDSNTMSNITDFQCRKDLFEIHTDFALKVSTVTMY